MSEISELKTRMDVLLAAQESQTGSRAAAFEAFKAAVDYKYEMQRTAEAVNIPFIDIVQGEKSELISTTEEVNKHEQAPGDIAAEMEESLSGWKKQMEVAYGNIQSAAEMLVKYEGDEEKAMAALDSAIAEYKDLKEKLTALGFTFESAEMLQQRTTKEDGEELNRLGIPSVEVK